MTNRRRAFANMTIAALLAGLVMALLAPTSAFAARNATKAEKAGMKRAARTHWYSGSDAYCKHSPNACKKLKYEKFKVSTKNRNYGSLYSGIPGKLDSGFFVLKRTKKGWRIANNPNTMGGCGGGPIKVPAKVCTDLGGNMWN